MSVHIGSVPTNRTVGYPSQYSDGSRVGNQEKGVVVREVGYTRGNSNYQHLHSRDNSIQRLANSANSEFIRMPAPFPPQGRTVVPPPVVNQNFQSQSITSTSNPAVRTTQSQAIFIPANRQESSSSVVDINQRLQSISSGIKEGRPVVVNYGNESSGVRNPTQQRTIVQGQSGSSSLPLPFPYGIVNSQNQTQIQTHQNQHIQPVISINQHNQSYSQPHFSSTTQQHHITQGIQPSYPQPIQNDYKQQILTWQSRYFTLIQRFQFFHARFQSISREYSQILDSIQNEDELQQRKEELRDLQDKIHQTQQQLIQIVNKNKELIGQSVNWKVKYEQLLNNKDQAQGQSPQLNQKLVDLQNQLQQIRGNHDKVIQSYQQQYQKVQKEADGLKLQYTQLSEEMSNMYNSIQQKDEQISTLRMLVDKQKSFMPQETNQSQNRSMVDALKKQRQELVKKFNQLDQEYQNYKNDVQGRIQEYKVDVRKKNDELERYQHLVREKEKVIQGIKSQSKKIIRNQKQQIQANTSSQKIKYLEDKIKENNREKEANQKKIQQYISQLQSRDNTISQLTNRLKQQRQQINQSIVSVSAQNIEPQNNLDLTQLNQNMIQMQKLYQLKSQQCEQTKKLNAQYEKMLENARAQFISLQKRYSQLSVKKQSRSSDSQGEVTILRKKLEQTQKKVKKLSPLEFQMDQLRRENQRLQREIRKTKASQTHQINDHIQLLEDNLGKKDQEISRLRQSNQLYQTNVDQLNMELDKIRLKASNDFKLGEGEKTDLKNTLVSYQFKLAEYQRKVNNLQQVKNMLQQQVSSVTTELHSKIDQIQKTQAQLRKERAKIKSFEDDLQVHLSETEQNKLKLKDNQRKSLNLIKSLQFQLDKKKQQSILKTNEAALLNNRIIELESTIKSKQIQINQLQKNSDALKDKINGFDSYFQEIKYLKSKISQYQHKVSSLAFRPVTRNYNVQPTQIFQRKIIYQLKLENQALKQRLGINGKVNGSARNKEGIDVRERLTDFNHKLQQLIRQDGSADLNGDGQLYKKYQRDRRKLIQKHNQEITLLKVKILELQSQPEHISGENVKFPSAQSVYNEQIMFYKEKNQQLEEMVDNHIKVNKDLRDSIQRLMRGQNDQYSLAYYKDQMIKANQLNQTLQDKLKRLQLEIRRLKDEMGKVNSRPVQNNAELEIRIVELNRRISQLVIQINQLQQDKVTSTQTISSLQKTILKLKGEIDVYIFNKQQQIRKQRQKENTFQQQISKQTSKMRIQASQIDQLNQLLNKRQMAESLELQNVKLKLNQYQEDIRKLRNVIEEYRSHQEHYQREMLKLQNDNQMLHVEIQRLRENEDVTVRKYKEYDLQINNFRTTISQFEARIRNKDAIIQENSYKETQLQQQLSRVKSQNGLLTQQIQRINDYSQKRITEKDVEIQRLKAMITALQQEIANLKDRLNQSRIYMSRVNQSNQQISLLEEQINRLKSALSSKSSDLDSRNQQILELNRRISLFEEQISSLRTTSDRKINQLEDYIYRLESQQKDSQKSRENLDLEKTGRISQLEAQIRQLQQTIRQLQRKGQVLETEIQNLNIRRQKQIYDLNQSIKVLEQIIRDLQKNKQEKDELYKRIAYLQQELNNLQRSKDEQILKLTKLLQTKEQQCQKFMLNANILTSKVTQIQAQFNHLKIQSQKQRKYYIDLIKSLELQISELKNGKVSSEGNTLHLQEMVQKLQAELILIKQRLTIKEREYLLITQKLTILTQKITTYQIEITKYKQTIIHLQTNWTNLDSAYKMLLGSSSYTIQYLRSILLSIQTLLEEEQALNVGVLEVVSRQIVQGLQESTRWHNELF